MCFLILGQFHHQHHCRLRNMPGDPKKLIQVTPNHVEDAL